MRPEKYNLENEEYHKTEYIKIITPPSSLTKYLSLSKIKLLPKEEIELISSKEELALFCMNGCVSILIKDNEYELEKYDAIYIPLNEVFIIRNNGEEYVKMVAISALCNKKYEVKLFKFNDLRMDKSGTKLKRLKGGRLVYYYIGPEEKASKIILGLTIFQPYAYSFPPHNHFDQEEIYLFLKGKGRIEVYTSENNKEFITNVAEGDIITIPFGYYHPVYNFDEEMHFLWATAGERYNIIQKANIPME
jgi:mannose-6-phosphate isomerase-like protein (cupin superfamily)